MQRHQYPAVAHISTNSVNLAFGPKSVFKNICMSGRVQASKWGPFTTPGRFQKLLIMVLYVIPLRQAFARRALGKLQELSELERLSDSVENVESQSTFRQVCRIF